MQLKKILANALVITGLLLYASGCENKGMEIGNNWVDPNTRVVVIDTCTVQLSSVLLDSVRTSGGERIFSGIYHSPLWGTTKASSFLSFSLTSDFHRNENPDEQQNIRFDSLTLYLAPDSMYCGDTTRLMTLNLHRLTERVELNDDSELYGHSAFRYDPAPLATRSFLPRPWYGKAREIRLPDELGREFLDKLVNQDDDVDDDESFSEYFNGMVLVPGGGCQAVLGYQAADTSCMIKLYYHTIASDKTERVLDFKLKPSLQFTRVESDRSGAPLDGIAFKNNEISSFDSGNMAFVEGLTGIYTKIEFPYLNGIRELGNYGAIVSALLVVYPMARTYGRRDAPLPDNLQLYISNELNVTTGSITDQNDEIQGGSLTVSDEFADKTYYTYDITDFIKSQLGVVGINKRNLQMIGSNYGYTLNNVVTGNQLYDGKNIELHLTYAIYNE